MPDREALTRGSASGWHVEPKADGGWYWHAYLGAKSSRGVASSEASAVAHAEQAIEAARADERARARVDGLRDA